MIKGLLNSGAMPALERMVQFTAARHRVMTDNIANLSNPFYKAKDLDPASFQAALSEAIDRRRDSINPSNQPLQLNDTRQVRFDKDGITVDAAEVSDTIMRHDQNNLDLERTMQRLAENTQAHNTSIELIRNEFALLETAIRERF